MFFLLLISVLSISDNSNTKKSIVPPKKKESETEYQTKKPISNIVDSKKDETTETSHPIVNSTVSKLNKNASNQTAREKNIVEEKHSKKKDDISPPVNKTNKSDKPNNDVEKEKNNNKKFSEKSSNTSENKESVSTKTGTHTNITQNEVKPKSNSSSSSSIKQTGYSTPKQDNKTSDFDSDFNSDDLDVKEINLRQNTPKPKHKSKFEEYLQNKAKGNNQTSTEKILVDPNPFNNSTKHSKRSNATSSTYYPVENSTIPQDNETQNFENIPTTIHTTHKKSHNYTQSVNQPKSKKKSDDSVSSIFKRSKRKKIEPTKQDSTIDDSWLFDSEKKSKTKDENTKSDSSDEKDAKTEHKSTNSSQIVDWNDLFDKDDQKSEKQNEKVEKETDQTEKDEEQQQPNPEQTETYNDNFDVEKTAEQPSKKDKKYDYSQFDDFWNPPDQKTSKKHKHNQKGQQYQQSSGYNDDYGYYQDTQQPEYTIELPEYWYDQATGQKHKFPQSELEYSLLPRKYQRAVDKILRQLEAEQNEKWMRQYHNNAHGRNHKYNTGFEQTNPDQYYKTKQDQYYNEQPQQDPFYNYQPEQDQYYNKQSKQDQYYNEQPKQDYNYNYKTKQDKYYNEQPKEDQYYPSQQNDPFYIEQPKQDQYYPDTTRKDQFYNDQSRYTEEQQAETERRKQNQKEKKNQKQNQEERRKPRRSNIEQLPPNTMKNELGELVCMEGYITDNSIISSKGCWKCTNKCDPNAKCVAMDKCVCRSGYSGDGFRCTAPIPHLVDSYVEKGQMSIKLKSMHSFDPSKGYCKFGSIVIQASYVSPNNIICQVPQNSRFSDVSVSFDGRDWSESLLFNSERFSQQEMMIILALVASAICLFLTILMCCCMSRKSNSLSSKAQKRLDEMLPLMTVNSMDNMEPLVPDNDVGVDIDDEAPVIDDE